DSRLARAAAERGVGFCLSTAANETIETIGIQTAGLRMFQLYTWGGRQDCANLMRRAQQAGFNGLIITADSLIAVTRERDRRNRFAHAVTMSPSLVMDGLLHPRWLFSTWVRHGMPRLENISDRLAPGASAHELAAYAR